MKIKKIMRPLSNLPAWVYKVIPISLLALGIILNIYAVSQWMSPRITEAPSSISSTSEPNSISKPLSVSNSISYTADTPLLKDGPPQYGHFPFAEADPASLMIIASYGQREYQRFESLLPEAAYELMKMIYAARDDGVWIVLASAFRDYEKQEELFANQITRKGSPEEAAKSSAPPGYSEHHTGYAVDLVDGHVPTADINMNFASTQAFTWLTQHAERFGYELSFPENNSQGVSYEPWHWRFKDSKEAQAVFSRT